jgi:hypothetical protein
MPVAAWLVLRGVATPADGRAGTVLVAIVEAQGQTELEETWGGYHDPSVPEAPDDGISAAAGFGAISEAHGTIEGDA